MKIAVFRKNYIDKGSDSLLCLCLALFLIAILTLIQTAIYESMAIAQPLFSNLTFCGVLGCISGFIGCAVSIIQSSRNKPLLNNKFVIENREITILFAYIASLSIVWIFLVSGLQRVPLLANSKIFSFEIFSLVHPYLLFAFFMLGGLIYISLHNVIKNMSLKTPKKPKRQ